MNNGKICISVCAKTADDLLERVRQAESLADVIEARFDCVDPMAIEKAVSELNANKPVLFTYRPVSQGGSAPDDVMQRIMFWMSAVSKTPMELEQILIDNELDFGGGMQWSSEMPVIRSFHDFNGVPNELESIYQELSANGIAKIAITAESITDAIPLWNLLEQARSDGKQMIPIAMGEAGKWTRILGPAHGGFMTYAALDSGAETAPGQISAADMIEVFRVKELDRQTKVHGIIAGNTSYSVSPWMHNAAFKTAGLNRVFIPLQVTELADFFRRMVRKETREVELNFAGFSVTNPHKQTIIGLLDELDETATKIGAVNTVKLENGKAYGYNTDAPGFISPLKNVFGDLAGANVAIAGGGGAARACIYALQQEGANVSLFVRDKAKVAELADEFNLQVFELDNSPFAADILVNATPLGTKGDNEDKTIAVAEQLRDVKLVYDLNYNPLYTLLIREARKADVPTLGGLEMVVAQGVKQFEIWTGESAPTEAMAAAVKKKLNL